MMYVGRAILYLIAQAGLPAAAFLAASAPSPGLLHDSGSIALILFTSGAAASYPLRGDILGERIIVSVVASFAISVLAAAIALAAPVPYTRLNHLLTLAATTIVLLVVASLIGIRRSPRWSPRNEIALGVAALVIVVAIRASIDIG